VCCGFARVIVEHVPLSPAASKLIVERIDSVRQLELVLLLHGDAARAWTASEVAAELRTSAPWAEEQLTILIRRGLVRRDGVAFRFAAEGELGLAAADLARAYASFPVTVVTVIYSNPNRAARSFADAFLLRRDPPPGSDAGGEGGPDRG
jgi:hypothetical protein